MMTSLLSSFFANRRKERQLSLSELAKSIGFKNVGKGAAILEFFEAGGPIDSGLLWSLAVALGVEDSELEAVVKEDRRSALRAWSDWVKKPIRPFALVQWIPSIHQRLPLDRSIESVEKAVDFASSLAASYRRRVCLVWSRKMATYFDEDGILLGRVEAAPGRPAMPKMRYGCYYCSALLCDEFGPASQEELLI